MGTELHDGSKDGREWWLCWDVDQLKVKDGAENLASILTFKPVEFAGSVQVSLRYMISFVYIFKFVADFFPC